MVDDQYKRIFSKNLRFYMTQNNKEQIDLINDLGFNKSAVSTWCNGTRLPRMDKVDALAKYFGINRSDLIEEKKESPASPRKGITINVYGRVAAGIPLEMIEDIIDTGEFFGLQIHGDSMEPLRAAGGCEDDEINCVGLQTVRLLPAIMRNNICT